MDTSKIKVKAGQIWTGNKGATTITISRVGLDSYGNHYAYKKFHNGESGFGPLTKDGCPDRWGVNWELVSDVEEPKPQSTHSKKHLDLLTFFSAVPDGYCACKVEKMHCPYHKDIK